MQPFLAKILFFNCSSLKSGKCIVAMVVYMKIDLHFAGIFTRYPIISYSDGVEKRFDDVDFVGMDKNVFLDFLQRFTNERYVNVYFCMPDVEFPDGLRITVTNIDYMEFIKVGYACGCVVPVHLDHLGVNVHQWIVEKQDEVYIALNELSSVN